MISVKNLIRTAASVKLLILCLVILSVLVVWGTFYQVEYGVHAAQRSFFNSWLLFTPFGLPLPGVKSIIALVSINLLSSFITSFRFKWTNTGILLVHAGTAVLFLSGAVSSFTLRESVLTLGEGECSRESIDFNTWDLMLSGNSREQKAEILDFSDLRAGKTCRFSRAGVSLAIQDIFTSCVAYGSSIDNLDSLLPKPQTKDQGANIPGLIASASRNGLSGPEITLYGGAGKPSAFAIGTDTFRIILQPRRVKLPASIGLISFSMETHPGTEDARRFTSRVGVSGIESPREAVISMNKPFRYGSFTFYQAGYSKEAGRILSTFSVVENPIRFASYTAGIIIMAGLFLHFFLTLTLAIISRKAR